MPFFEAKTTRDQRIVWTIEIAPDEDKKEDRQSENGPAAASLDFDPL